MRGLATKTILYTGSAVSAKPVFLHLESLPFSSHTPITGFGGALEESSQSITNTNVLTVESSLFAALLSTRAA